MVANGNSEIISLDNIISTQKIGGKATNLGILKQAGFNVPEGIAVPYFFYEDYIKNGSLDPALITQILNNFTNDTLLAVRSSGNVEDSLRLSFAGQFNTTLNVEKKQLAEAIIDSYNSARDYERNGYGKDNPDILMGLVVQEMIDPLYSGVIFTLDPTTGDHNTIVINYKEGLGEYLVSGKVTGTVLKLDKNNPTTTYNHLPENIVKEIVYISGKVEELFDFPQDIEFAVSKNGLHLLQSRPITSYSLNTIEVIKQEKQIIEKLVAKEEKLFNLETIFSNSNIIENFPEPTPMGLEIFNHIFTGTKEIPGAIQLGRNDFGYNCGKETFQNSLFRMICGKPFMDFVVDSLTFRIKGITLEDYLSGFTADYLQQVREDNSKGNYPEGGLYIQHPSKEFLIKRFGEEKGNQYHTAYQEFHKQIKEKEKTFYLEFTNELEPSISKLYKEELKIDFNDLSTEELVMKFNEYLEVLRTRTCVDFVKVARLAFFGYDRLKNNIEQFVKTLGPSFLKKKLKGEIEPEINIDSLDKQTLVKYTLDILLQAKPDNIINETERLGIALNELITNQLSVDEFILRYGHVGQLEISLPRYAEEKEYFSNLQKQESTENESKKTLAGFQFRKELAEQMLLIGATKEEINNFIYDAEMANIYLPLRETAKMSYFKIHYLVKKCLTCLSEKCGLEGNEIYMLKPLELSELIENFNKTFQKIKYREAQQEAYKEIDLTSLIFKDTKIKRIDFDQNNGYYLSIPGEAVRRGMAEGISLVARTNIELVKKYAEYVREGIENIIGVFPAMDPSYGTRSNFSGLITQYGGPLAHAAIIARDQKIPYLTNVQIGKLPDKTKILIDGTEGMVYVKK